MKKFILLTLLSIISIFTITTSMKIKALSFSNGFFDYYQVVSSGDVTPHNLNYPDDLNYFRNTAVYDSLTGRLSGWAEDETYYGGELVYLFPVDYSVYSFMQIQFNEADGYAIYRDYEEWDDPNWVFGDSNPITPKEVYFLFYRAFGESYSVVRAIEYDYNGVTMKLDPFTIELNIAFDLMAIVITYYEDFDGITQRLDLGEGIRWSSTPSDLDELFEFGLLGSADAYDEGYADGYSLGYAQGYDVGEGDGYIAGGEGYDIGYADGQDDMYDNGSDTYGYDQTGSQDYIDGMVIGGSSNVNAGITNFMNNFDKWIVPAIVVVILLGGFLSIAVIKRRGD